MKLYLLAVGMWTKCHLENVENYCNQIFQLRVFQWWLYLRAFYYVLAHRIFITTLHQSSSATRVATCLVVSLVCCDHVRQRHLPTRLSQGPELCRIRIRTADDTKFVNRVGGPFQLQRVRTLERKQRQHR